MPHRSKPQPQANASDCSYLPFYHQLAPPPPPPDRPPPNPPKPPPPNPPPPNPPQPKPPPNPPPNGPTPLIQRLRRRFLRNDIRMMNSTIQKPIGKRPDRRRWAGRGAPVERFTLRPSAMRCATRVAPSTRPPP